MGCASTKLLDGDEFPEGLKPLQRKIEDAKKHHRRGRLSTVSATELLTPEHNASDSSSGKAKHSAIVPEPMPEEKEFGTKRKDGNNKNESSHGVDEDLVGSPSFRFYCADLPPDNRSFDSIESVKLPQFHRTEDVKEASDKNQENKATMKPQISIEDSEGKIIKKEKGRKLLTLPKAPVAVQNLFTCYTATHYAASNQQKK